MPKLILKSPYLKCGGKGGGSVSGYLRYIGTRDGVELVPDGRPATKRQEQLIRALVRDFPDSKELLEYVDWEALHTKAHASTFITTALECNWEQANRSDVYLKYIATRTRVERLGSHGLFGDDDSVDLQRAAAELDSYTGNVWTHIISLKREDAASIPIIAISADAFYDDVRRCLDCGMNAPTPKPIDIQELARLLAQFLPPRQAPADGAD